MAAIDAGTLHEDVLHDVVAAVDSPRDWAARQNAGLALMERVARLLPVRFKAVGKRKHAQQHAVRHRDAAAAQQHGAQPAQLQTPSAKPSTARSSDPADALAGASLLNTPPFGPTAAPGGGGAPAHRDLADDGDAGRDGSGSTSSPSGSGSGSVGAGVSGLAHGLGHGLGLLSSRATGMPLLSSKQGTVLFEFLLRVARSLGLGEVDGDADDDDAFPGHGGGVTSPTNRGSKAEAALRVRRRAALESWHTVSLRNLRARRLSLRSVLAQFVPLMMAEDLTFADAVFVQYFSSHRGGRAADGTALHAGESELVDQRLFLRILQRYAVLRPSPFFAAMDKYVKSESSQRHALELLERFVCSQDTHLRKLADAPLLRTLVSLARESPAGEILALAIWILLVVTPYVVAALGEYLPDLLFVLRRGIHIVTGNQEAVGAGGVSGMSDAAKRPASSGGGGEEPPPSMKSSTITSGPGIVPGGGGSDSTGGRLVSLALRTAVPTLFRYLYNVFPCMFLQYMRAECENDPVVRDFAGGILSQLRVLPALLGGPGEAEAEASGAHWRNLDQDAIFERFAQSVWALPLAGPTTASSVGGSFTTMPRRASADSGTEIDSVGYRMSRGVVPPRRPTSRGGSRSGQGTAADDAEPSDGGGGGSEEEGEAMGELDIAPDVLGLMSELPTVVDDSESPALVADSDGIAEDARPAASSVGATSDAGGGEGSSAGTGGAAEMEVSPLHHAARGMLPSPRRSESDTKRSFESADAAGRRIVSVVPIRRSRLGSVESFATVTSPTSEVTTERAGGRASVDGRRPPSAHVRWVATLRHAHSELRGLLSGTDLDRAGGGVAGDHSASVTAPAASRIVAATEPPPHLYLGPAARSGGAAGTGPSGTAAKTEADNTLEVAWARIRVLEQELVFEARLRQDLSRRCRRLQRRAVDLADAVAERDALREEIQRQREELASLRQASERTSASHAEDRKQADKWRVHAGNKVVRFREERNMVATHNTQLQRAAEASEARTRALETDVSNMARQRMELSARVRELEEEVAVGKRAEARCSTLEAVLHRWQWHYRTEVKPRLEEAEDIIARHKQSASHREERAPSVTYVVDAGAAPPTIETKSSMDEPPAGVAKAAAAMVHSASRLSSSVKSQESLGSSPGSSITAPRHDSKELAALQARVSAAESAAADRAAAVSKLQATLHTQARSAQQREALLERRCDSLKALHVALQRKLVELVGREAADRDDKDDFPELSDDGEDFGDLSGGNVEAGKSGGARGGHRAAGVSDDSGTGGGSARGDDSRSSADRRSRHGPGTPGDRLVGRAGATDSPI